MKRGIASSLGSTPGAATSAAGAPTVVTFALDAPVFESIRALLERKFNVAPSLVQLESQLVRDLKIDPIDVEDLPLALEEAFEIDISNVDGGAISTVSDAVECVLRSRRR